MIDSFRLRHPRFSSFSSLFLLPSGLKFLNSFGIMSVCLMMEAARTSETSVDNYFTRQYIPEDNSELRTLRRENLKSHNVPEVNESEL
jgi:hypothetical protein